MFLNLKDTIYYDEADDPKTNVYWTGTWNYEQLWLEDYNSVSVYKLSRLLNKITNLQVTSPDLDGRESEIPIPFELVSDIHSTSDDLMVMKILMTIILCYLISFSPLMYMSTFTRFSWAATLHLGFTICILTAKRTICLQVKKK